MDKLYFPRLEPKGQISPKATNEPFGKSKGKVVEAIVSRFYLENTEDNEDIRTAIKVLNEYVEEDLHLAYGNYLYINLPEPKPEKDLRIKLGKSSKKYGVYCHIHEENERLYIGNLPRYMGEILTALKESKQWSKKQLSKQLGLKFTSLSETGAGVGFVTRPWMPWWMHQKRELYRFNVAGVTFENRQTILKQISENLDDFCIDIARDFDNIYDANAVMVLASEDKKLHHVGYVPKRDAKHIAGLLDNNSPYTVRMVSCGPFEVETDRTVYAMKLQFEVLLASHYNKWVAWSDFDINEWRAGGAMKCEKIIDGKYVSEFADLVHKKMFEDLGKKLKDFS